MNVFQTHSEIVSDYATYIRSFLKIDDPAIRHTVEEALNQGKLWPEPLLQFNPSFEMYGSLEKLAQTGDIHPDIRDIFKGYSLYKHQVDAIRLGTSGTDFIVTSGTGSGKSLTYIGSIFHHLLSNPSSKGVTAIVVYPMNALINSQHDEFTRYKDNYEKNTGKEFPITFGQYTGQEKEERRTEMLENPPQILLTNYMMLELLLTRLRERPIRDAIYENLNFLVFDELHTYRGRQGADVALLIRRIRASCIKPVVCIGTSATMVSVGSLAEQRSEVAKVATKLFGKPFTPDQIINETLARSLEFKNCLPNQGELASAINAGVDLNGDSEVLKSHPVAVWLENVVALEEREAQLVRGKPQRLSKIAELLSIESGKPTDQCEQFLKNILQWIPLNVGLMMFNPEPWRFFPVMQIDVVWFPKEGPGGNKFSEKVFKGPIPRMTRDALDYIKRNLITETVIKHHGRAESTRVENFPYDAIEEAVVNAVYHRGYDTREPIEIRLEHTELMVISYPGPDRSVRLEQLRAGRAQPRRYRNRRIGEFLKELEFTEGRSTGIPKIMEAMEKNGSPPAEFEFDEDHSYFMVRLPIHPAALEVAESATSNATILSATVGAGDTAAGAGTKSGLSRDQVEILRKCLADSQIADLMAVADRTNRTKFRDQVIKPMLTDGLLEMTIPDKPTSSKQRYRTTDKGKTLLAAMTRGQQ